jgi:dienelactone hydrolase
MVHGMRAPRNPCIGIRTARARRCAISLAVGLGCIAALGAAHAQTASPEIAQIVVEGPRSDGEIRMATAVYKPPGAGKWPVLIYSHGRSGSDADRRRVKPPDPRGHIRYWLQKGFAVVAPTRPGYGDTGGADREYSGVRYDIFGNCWGPPDFGRAAAAATTAITATLEWLRHQPWADTDRIVLAGSSMGGLASIASAATNPPGVVAYINFAGGTGGDSGRAPKHSCGSEEMATLMRLYGRTTHVPGLWLYAENDLYWGAEWPRAWYRAFASGGGHTEFVMTEPVPNTDGHQLLARGGRLWVDHVDRFLAELGF